MWEKEKAEENRGWPVGDGRKYVLYIFNFADSSFLVTLGTKVRSVRSRTRVAAAFSQKCHKALEMSLNAPLAASARSSQANQDLQ